MKTLFLIIAAEMEGQEAVYQARCIKRKESTVVATIKREAEK